MLEELIQARNSYVTAISRMQDELKLHLIEYHLGLLQIAYLDALIEKQRMKQGNYEWILDLMESRVTEDD